MTIFLCSECGARQGMDTWGRIVGCYPWCSTRRLAVFYTPRPTTWSTAALAGKGDAK